MSQNIKLAGGGGTAVWLHLSSAKILCWDWDVRGGGKTYQSEAVNLCSDLQVDPLDARLSDMLNRSRLIFTDFTWVLCSRPFLLIISVMFFLIFHLSKNKKIVDLIEHSVFCSLTLKSITRDPYIWVPVPDDVKTGDDPKPRRTESSSERSAACCFPFLCLRDIFLPGGASGSHLRRPSPWVRRTNSTYPDTAGGGGTAKETQTPSMHL